MSLEDDQLLDLKDAIVTAFHPMENLFKIMNRASLEDGEEMARYCGEVGLELARSFRVKLDAALERLTVDTRQD